MKQVFRRVIDRRGRIVVLDLPEPHLGPIRCWCSRYSLISWARSRPRSRRLRRAGQADAVRPMDAQRREADGVRTGVGQTARRVWHEMITPREIGYSGAGEVLAIGDNVEGFKIGQTVAYAATGHAEIAAPTLNHVVPVPDGVSAPARRSSPWAASPSRPCAEPTSSSARRLRSTGSASSASCAPRSPGRRAASSSASTSAPGPTNWPARAAPAGRRSRRSRVETAHTRLHRQARRRRHDHLRASDSPEVVNSSMEITRRQGRVVIVGYVRLDIHPKNFLYREIDLRYSRAYGPGSYHTGYEKGRLDYPFGYVRWTEKRNLAEFVRLLAAGAISVEPLDRQDLRPRRRPGGLRRDPIWITTWCRGPAALPGRGARSPADDAGPCRPESGRGGRHLPDRLRQPRARHAPPQPPIDATCEIRGIASATARNAAVVAERVGAATVTTDVDDLLSDRGPTPSWCARRSPSTSVTSSAIEAGKSVMVEKPLVTRLDDLRELLGLMEDRPVLLSPWDSTGAIRRWCTG